MNIGNHTMRRSLAASLLLAASTLHAQQLPDPANLTGEHVAPQSPADTLPINHGAPALQQLLLKLRTRASMMLIVAHPDDEDGGLLTYESRGQGARVAMLTLTRGEGGQNLMSSDFDDALGLIRTQELLAADRYLGVDQMFGTEVDFGFSKTIEEAFSKWTHERVLYDAVRAVRLYRPLVLASVFLGAPTDGHGQHQVSGEICQEVFTAAADPKVFPDMIKEGLLPWAPLKVYARVPFSRVGKDGMFDYATGKTIPTRFQNYVSGKVTNIEPVASVQIHEGDPASISFNGQPAQPALGMEGLTYVQFARKGLALQKTQIGLGVRTAPPGRSDTGYTLIASRTGCSPQPATALCPIHDSLPVMGGPEQQPSSSHNVSSFAAGGGPASVLTATTHEDSLFAGIDTSLPALASLAPNASPAIKVVLKVNLSALDSDLTEAQASFDPVNTGKTAPALLEALKAADFLIGQVESFKPQYIPQNECANLLHELRIKRVQLNNALLLALNISADVTLLQPDADLLTTQTKIAADIHLTLPPTATLKSAGITSQGTEIAAALLPLHPPAISIRATLAHPLPATRPYFSAEPDQAIYKIANPALRNAPATPAPLVASLRLDIEGSPLELQTVVRSPQSPPRAAVVVPALSIMLTPSTGIITPAGHALALATVVDSHTSAASASISLHAPGNWEVSPPQFRLESTHPGERSTKPFTVVPKNYFAGQNYEITATVSDASQNYHDGFRPVGYPGLTYTNFYTPATYRAAAVDVTTAPSLHIAYLPGTGDAVPDFLPSLGLTPTLITPADLTPDKLKQFDAILVGVRAYAAQSALAGKGSQPLIDFARSGGIVILQYMTARFGDAEAPYPISVPGDSAHNVVEEAQPVTLPDPAAPLLNWPNKITPADFKGWVSEYGHGFAASWSPQYQPLLEAHDVGQDPQKGGLLLAPLGKGAYIYCALALYRQLPEGVPGAYRLLANLISYAKNPQR